MGRGKEPEVARIIKMLLPCSRARAVFAAAGVQLANAAPAGLLLDEHGGTFVLRVDGLEVLEVADPAADSGIWLEVALPLPESLLAEIRGFAGNYRLPLAPMSPPPSELTEVPILAAGHVPGKNLFVYCEESALQVRATGPQTLELARHRGSSGPGRCPAGSRPGGAPDRGRHGPAAVLLAGAGAGVALIK